MADVVVRAADRWLFRCPGCGCAHFFDSRWAFNGNRVRPTFGPSLLVYESGDQPRCHSFVTDGAIQYLGDSGHELAGKTVPLPPWHEEAARG